MDKAERYIAKIIFQNRVLKYKGQQFEDFFVAIMTRANAQFQAVKAYGNIGDRKNDGFDRTTGTYYQVYAPEELSKNTTAYTGAKKLKEDFEKLYNNWNDICPIKKFFFVVNDRFEGLPEPIINMSITLNCMPEYSAVNIETFTAKDLERVFDALDDLAKQDIIGIIPDEIMKVVEYDALQETVDYLRNKELPENYPDKLVVPDFDNKIIFNGLSSVVSNYLVTGSYYEGQLSQYFNENPGVKEILQKRFHALYEEAKRQISDQMENYADRRFYYILEQACPKRTMSIQTCVLVLMAYYFSGCDIFEEPN